jgi:hypothetical protein
MKRMAAISNLGAGITKPISKYFYSIYLHVNGRMDELYIKVFFWTIEVC